ncbi:hypothetical protein MCHLDSM_00775 [Mycolicibacterium chlorophenolicum]|uniref:Uncharacterized protein n=2 Tax=Mycolicibacterium chlorophenolicum TaxID=37916 RepID=A0A0J6WLH7_9MYCO|nr:hypothetical protein MCHLDSM_00775 [Mycolicibacterium chlorophenolicum]
MPQSLNRRRVVLLGAAVLLVVVITVAAFHWWLPALRLSAARGSWQPPPDATLSSSMREQPVPGWRTTVADLGLPPTSDSRIAVSNDPSGPRPFIGSIGTSAYFLASSGAAEEPQWWLAGMDVRDGRPLFNAVPLRVSMRDPECFLNGPNDILCLDGLPSVTARVIDGKSGAVKYVGPTDLRLGFGKLDVEQVGIYAVATTQDQGVYGIGQRAETTWFVPGDGGLRIVPPGRPDAESQTLTAQHEANPRTLVATVFSVADGKVVEPEIEEGGALVNPVFYPGGFASEVEDSDGLPQGVSFFDESGKVVGERDGKAGALATDTAVDLPVVSTDQQSTVYSAGGEELIEVPGGTLQRVGTTLMINMAKSQTFPEWQQYNMKDGAKGPVCDYPMQNLLGTDGSTLVFEVTNFNAEILAKAYDLHSCERLWSIPKRAGSVDRIWLIDGVLVQLRAAATELNALVAPG